jgi:hypothetical protein
LIKRSFVLSFQLTESEQAIQIDCDEKGMKILLDALARARAAGAHVHLCAPSIGGHELNQTTPFGERAIGEVIISYVQE